MNNLNIIELCEAMLYLIEPIRWENIYIPFLPFHLVNNIDAIQGFLIGMSKIHMDYVKIMWYRLYSTIQWMKKSFSTLIKMFSSKMEARIRYSCPARFTICSVIGWLHLAFERSRRYYHTFSKIMLNKLFRRNSRKYFALSKSSLMHYCTSSTTIVSSHH